MRLSAVAYLLGATAHAITPPSVPIPFNPKKVHSRGFIKVDLTTNLVKNGSVYHRAVVDNVNTSINKPENTTTILSGLGLDNSTNTPGPKLDHVSISHELDSIANHDDPYQAWREHQVAAPYKYWDQSLENVAASNTVRFFEEFVKDYQNEDTMECKAKGLGVVNCFQWVYTGNSDFRCTIDNLHMCGQRTPQEIMQHVDVHWPQKSLKDRVDLARQIHFVSGIINKVLMADNRFYGLIAFMETFALSQVLDLVKAFTPQVDGLRVRNCELAKKLLNLTFDMSVHLLQDITGIFFFPEVTGIVFKPILESFWNKKVLALAREGTATLMPKLFGDLMLDEKERNEWMKILGNLIGTGVNVDQWHSIVAKFKAKSGLFNFDTQPGSDRDKEHEQAALPMLNLLMTTSTNMCGNKYGVINDDNISHVSKLQSFIVEYSTTLRGMLDLAFRSHFNYDNTASPTKILAKFRQISMLTHRDIFDSDLSVMERSIKRSFTEVLASELLTGSRNFLKCEERDDALTVCSKGTQNTKNVKDSQSYYCPPGTNYVCQAVGWSKQQTHNHLVSIPGLEGGFQRFDLTPQTLMQNSWDHHLANRGEEQWNNMIAEYKQPTNMLNIPVCLSKVRTIEEIKPASFGEHRHWRNGFPFFCGDHHANETLSFLQQTGINPNDEPSLLSDTLANNLKRISLPANRYALLCRLNVRWPTWSHSTSRFDTKDKLVLNSADTQCASFMAQTAPMDEVDTNVHFCTDPAMVQHLRREHPWLINTMPNAKSHKRMCRRWLRRNRKLVGERLGGVRGMAGQWEEVMGALRGLEEGPKGNKTMGAGELGEADEADEADDKEWAAEDSGAASAKRWLTGAVLEE